MFHQGVQFIMDANKGNEPVGQITNGKKKTLLPAKSKTLWFSFWRLGAKLAPGKWANWACPGWLATLCHPLLQFAPRLEPRFRKPWNNLNIEKWPSAILPGTETSDRKLADGREWMELLPFIILFVKNWIRRVCSLHLKRSTKLSFYQVLLIRFLWNFLSGRRDRIEAAD